MAKPAPARTLGSVFVLDADSRTDLSLPGTARRLASVLAWAVLIAAIALLGAAVMADAGSNAVEAATVLGA